MKMTELRSSHTEMNGCDWMMTDNVVNEQPTETIRN